MKSKNFGLLSCAAVLVAALAMGGCASSGARGYSQLPPRERPTAYAWDCDGDVSVVTEYRDDGMWLFAPEVSTLLPHAISASGARYAAGELEFWSKGMQARYTRGETVLQCNENRRRTWFEDAKLRGADYRGIGNEPGWSVEIGPDAIYFTGDYGATRLAFAAGQPDVSDSERIAVWHSASGDDEITVRIAGEPCRDDMSGEPFGSRVTITLNGTVYRGCGEALH